MLKSFFASAPFMVGWLSLLGKPAPDYLPVVKKRMKRGDYTGSYVEREITAPVVLCDANGNLNPQAIGWSRVPLHRCNLSGHFPRKKKWNYWCVISPRFAFSFNPINIDYLGNALAVFLIDFTNNSKVSATAHGGFGTLNTLPEEVEKSVEFTSNKMTLSMRNEENKISVRLSAKSLGGAKAEADFVIHKPAGHETLNVVIPWTEEMFQFTSKQNTLPVEGVLEVGNKKYDMKPDDCHAVLDFGRGIWPYRTYWNWGAVTGTVDGVPVGVNMGAKWTTGTGANENGICYNGKLYKIMEDLEWTYDISKPYEPWRVKSLFSDVLSLELKPVYVDIQSLNLGVVATHGVVAFGKWSGRLKVENKIVEVDELMGWGEELRWKW